MGNNRAEAEVAGESMSGSDGCVVPAAVQIAVLFLIAVALLASGLSTKPKTAAYQEPLVPTPVVVATPAVGMGVRSSRDAPWVLACANAVILPFAVIGAVLDVRKSFFK